MVELALLRLVQQAQDPVVSSNVYKSSPYFGSAFQIQDKVNKSVKNFSSPQVLETCIVVQDLGADINRLVLSLSNRLGIH